TMLTTRVTQSSRTPTFVTDDSGALEISGMTDKQFPKDHKRFSNMAVAESRNVMAWFQSWCTGLRGFPDCANPNRSELNVTDLDSGKRLLSIPWSRGAYLSHGQLAVSPNATRVAIWNRGQLSIWTVPAQK